LNNPFKRYERLWFVLLLLLAIDAAIYGTYSILAGWANGAKWLATSGLLATVTGVVQLEISGLFDKVFQAYESKYSNPEEYPYGPPSHITREIIWNPDAPVAMWFRDTCFFEHRTGFWLIVVGTLIQIPAAWLT
jgi:hypothetical protein